MRSAQSARVAALQSTLPDKALPVTTGPPRDTPLIVLWCSLIVSQAMFSGWHVCGKYVMGHVPPLVVLAIRSLLGLPCLFFFTVSTHPQEFWSVPAADVRPAAGSCCAA